MFRPLIFVVVFTPLVAQPPSADLEWFEKEVRPVLAEHCQGCHGPKRQRADLRLDHIQSILAGGANGPAIVKGSPDASRLMRAVRYDDVHLRMPPKGKLPDATIATLKKWIEKGAPWPDEPVPSGSAKKEEFDLIARRAAHWCWKELKKPVPPTVADRRWVKDPIDAFILAGLERDGLRPAAAADRGTYIRRLSFALRGLPPSPTEVEAFVADRRPDAYEKLVDSYLASPRFGEHWGRHWLDLMRYAESYGHEFDYPIPHPWRYRDYVIRALNDDVPYDRFAKEHIAGDLMTSPRPHPTEQYDESILGTGFWHLHQATHAPVDVRHDEAEKIDNQIDVLTKTFLGLTVACARCHDHKFDAISTADYYALAGYLQSSRRQIAYIDPRGEIAAASRDLDDIRAKGSAALKRFRFPTDAPKYVAAALEGRKLMPPARPQREAEDLKPSTTTAGSYRRQPVRGTSKGHHMWWTGARPGDRLTIKVPVEQAGRYKVELGLTKAPDYARTRISLGGTKLLDIDLYDEKVRSSGTLDGGEHDLPAGQLDLVFEIVGANEKAKKSFMVGFDWIRLVPVRATGPELDAVARKHGVDVERMKQWITALADPPASRGAVRDGDIVFADAARGDFTRWTRHGEAFTFDGGFYGEGDSGRLAPAVPHSGLRSRKHQGALRSPTFKITKRHIHYRVAGEGVKIRVIIDGYMMDVYNGLLFGGVSFDVRNPKWHWHQQGGDYSRYIGHTAYIEINDDGGGWVALDRIVFSDHGPPGDPPQDLAARVSSASANEDALLRDWGLRHGLLTGGDPAAVADLARRWRERGQRTPGAMRALAMCDGTAENEYVFIRGKHQNRGPVVPRRILEALGGRPEHAPPSGSGRLDLANRMFDDANPLPARVMANRVWHHLIGRGIVPTVDNFGVLGARPSHPELLDWLAYGFREDGWSIKRLIRRIVLSSTWRMSSAATDERAEAEDPTNTALHRMNLVRLTGETIRDSVLAVSGRLDTKMYGPSIAQHLTPFMTGRGRPGRSGPVDGAGRRSIYLAVRRNFLDPLFLAFDGPIPFTSVGRRSRSNVPAQALALMNAPLISEQARRWARKAIAEHEDVTARLDAMYLAAFARKPSAEERGAIVRFAKRQAKAFGAGGDSWRTHEDTWADVAHVLFNNKEFIFVR